MKIACVAYLHGNGGAERQITMLANSLTDYGHEVYLIALTECNLRYDIKPNVHLINLSETERNHCCPIFYRFISFFKIMKKLKPDVSIHFWFQSAYFSAIMPKLYSGKIIYSERGDPGDKEYFGLLGIIRKHAIKRIDGFVFQTIGAQNYFDEGIKKRSIVIANPISIPTKFDNLKIIREKRIVAVGRLHPQKNYKLLLDAFYIIHKKLPEYKLEIYGEGAQQEELEKYINDNDLKNSVYIYKPRKEILECICSASLFVLTSDYEGMPNALMEAMALGLPCISTDCRPGGARALIENGYNGYIIPVGDKELLVKRMLYILENSSISESIGENAKKIRASHSCSSIYDLWNKFLEKLL